MYPNKEKSAIKKAKYRNKHFTPNNFSDSDGEEDEQWCPWRFLIFFFKVFRLVMFLMWKWCYPPPFSSEVVMSPVMFSMRMAEVQRKLSFMVVSLRTDHSFLREENKGSPSKEEAALNLMKSINHNSRVQQDIFCEHWVPGTCAFSALLNLFTQISRSTILC